MKRLNLSEKEAKQRIQREDKRRADNYRYYTGRIWGVAANFDITLKYRAWHGVHRELCL